jgi:hypothetical protein
LAGGRADALVGGLSAIFGPLVGSFFDHRHAAVLAGFGHWVTVIQGSIFLICVLTFRGGVIGEIAHYFRRSFRKASRCESVPRLAASRGHDRRALAIFLAARL